MKKERILLVVIIVILIVISIKYMQLSAEYNWKQGNADMEFKSSLSYAMSAFGTDFNSPSNKNYKQYYYNEAMSNTYVSSQLLGFTTYDSKSDGLEVALYNLYKLMEQDEYKNDIMKKSKSIYDNLSILSRNPIDKKATDNIIKLTEKIRARK